jgi:hypothetical protein
MFEAALFVCSQLRKVAVFVRAILGYPPRAIFDQEAKMRLAVVLVSVLALGGTATLGWVSPQAEASPKVCLKFRDLQGLKRVGERTFIANTRYNKGKYLVTMRDACRSLEDLDNFYTVRLYSDRECFDGDDVLVFRWGGSCSVESVVPAPAN